MKPVVAIYSTFLQRAYDQLIHDVAIQNLPVVFALDRAGLVGADGATHDGAFDLAYLRCIPNLTVMAPADENECRQMLYTAFQLDTPGGGALPARHRPGRRDPPGRCRRCRWARAKCAGRAPGSRSSLSAACSRPRSRPPRSSTRRWPTCASSSRWTRPWSNNWRAEHELLVTVEEGSVMGGAGSAVAEHLAAAGLTPQLLHLGLPDRFVDHGDTAVLLAEVGLDKAGLLAAIRAHPGG